MKKCELCSKRYYCCCTRVVVSILLLSFLHKLQVEELRSSERTLRTRVKSLTNELAVLKRR